MCFTGAMCSKVVATRRECSNGNAYAMELQDRDYLINISVVHVRYISDKYRSKVHVRNSIRFRCEASVRAVGGDFDQLLWRCELSCCRVPTQNS
jgi:hypothetical protein